MKSELTPKTLRVLADAYLARDLRVNPEYQRGTKWNLSQKQSLIDSLLSGYQVPLFPAPWTCEHKFWPTVARIDNVDGDRNLFCACRPMEDFAE